MNAAASAERKERMESSGFGLWFWVATGGFVVLFPFLVLSPFFGHIGARVSRWSGLPPRIWRNDTRVLTMEVDDQGLLRALVYDGAEQLFDPRQKNFRYWVRRWERDRGIVWERRAEQALPGVVRIVDGVVIYPTQDGLLRGMDARTGAPRWECKFGLERLVEPTVVVGTTLLITGRDTTTKKDAWLRIDVRDGSVVAKGGENFDAVVRELTASEPQGPEPSLDDFDGWRRRLGGDAQARRFLKQVSDDRSVPFVDNQTKVVKVPRPPRDRYLFDLAVERQAGQHPFRYVFGLGDGEPEIESVREHGAHGVVLVRNVYREGRDKEPVALILDMARGRVVADLAESATKVLAPDGTMRSLRL